MKSPALALAVLVTLGSAGSSLFAQTKAPAPAPRPATGPPAAAPKPAAKPPGKTGPRSNAADRHGRGPDGASKKEGLVIFTGNVVAKQDNSVQNADRMEVYLDDKGERVLRIVSTGNVKIVTEDCRTGTAKRAEYYDLDQRLVLIGNAQVWQEDNVVTGESIMIFSRQDRSDGAGGPAGAREGRVLPERDDEKQEAAAAPVAKKDDKRPGACG